MKINSIYEKFKTDLEANFNMLGKNQMEVCLDEINADIKKLWELKRQIFYKRQQFNMMFKNICSHTFNNICDLWHISDCYEKGFFRLNGKDLEKEHGDILEALTANFFPKRMWPGLEFLKFMQEGYGAEWFYFSFVWTYTVKGSKKKRKAEFEIKIPNPTCITQRLYQIDDEISESNPFDDNADWKTKVYVNTNFKDAESYSSVYDFVGSAWTNTEIRELIDNQACLLEGKEQRHELDS